MDNLYKKIYEEKVDILEKELNIEKKKLKKKEIIGSIIYLCICMLIEVVFFFSSQLLPLKNFYYIAILIIGWMGFWVILDIVYAIVNNEMASKKIRIFMQIFFHISFIAAAFIAGIISVFEVFFRKMKIIEIYKHLYEVVCSVVSAIYLGMSSSWLIIKVVEKGIISYIKV